MFNTDNLSHLKDFPIYLSLYIAIAFWEIHNFARKLFIHDFDWNDVSVWLKSQSKCINVLVNSVKQPDNIDNFSWKSGSTVSIHCSAIW